MSSTHNTTTSSRVDTSMNPQISPQYAISNCTHMTVTRLYTKAHACSLCHRPAASGWLYRCTQDRELMLEHDMKEGREEKLDQICDILPRSVNIKKWSAEARENPLSLLQEMTNSQFQTYTPDQLGRLLQQRTHLQAILARCSKRPSNTLMHKLGPPRPTIQPSSFDSLVPKPWVPELECQYKVCASCRPSFRERAFLSLDGIVNGDIPATTTLGFGFHLGGGRPIAKHEIVKKIQLQSCLSAGEKEEDLLVRLRRLIRKGTPSMQDEEEMKNLLAEWNGLGPHADASGSEGKLLLSIKDHDKLRRQLDKLTSLRGSQSEDITSHALAGNSLPPERVEEPTPISRPTSMNDTAPKNQNSPTIIIVNSSSSSLYSDSIKSSDESDQDIHQTALHPQRHTTTSSPSQHQVVTSCGSGSGVEGGALTAMEVVEATTHIFSSEPLEVQDGVAVMEESVELHVADLITQA